MTPQRGMGFDKIAERIYQYSEVEAVYLMSGAYYFTVFIEGKTMRQVAQFVSDRLAPMESVLSTATPRRFPCQHKPHRNGQKRKSDGKLPSLYWRLPKRR